MLLTNGLQVGGSDDPPSWFQLICLHGSQKAGKHLRRVTTLLKDMIKDTNEDSDEEIHRARAGRVPSAGASVPVQLGGVPLLVWMCSPTWKLSELGTTRILWRLPHGGVFNYKHRF